MTECETLKPGHQDMVSLHAKDDVTAGEGERGYVEHVKAQKLSPFERFIVIGAVVLLGFAGFAAHNDTTDPMTTSAIVAPAAAATEDSLVPHHPHYGHCREVSPYPDKSC